MATIYLFDVNKLFQFKCMALYEKFINYTKEVLEPPKPPPPPNIIHVAVSNAVQKLVQKKIIFA